MCMTYIMASITKKMIRGKPYYYARECKRINGKPKIVWQQYLGRPEDIIQTMTQPSQPIETRPKPKEAVIVEFGAVAVLYDLAKRLRLTEHIDRHAPKQGSGATVGDYLLLAIVNRCVAPCSKAGIAKWLQGTVLRRLIDMDSGQLSSQRFWENMDRISPQAIESIEKDITVQMVRDFDIDLKRVLFDGTNFFTFIDSFNERSTIAQRGKSKEGCRALRIIGLALMASRKVPITLSALWFQPSIWSCWRFRSRSFSLLMARGCPESRFTVASRRCLNRCALLWSLTTRTCSLPNPEPCSGRSPNDKDFFAISNISFADTGKVKFVEAVGPRSKVFPRKSRAGSRPDT